MDIQKEREAFEAYMAEKYKNLVDRRQCLNNGGGYMAWDMNVAWQVWQAAKAQAVPDGFVLVKKRNMIGNPNVDWLQAPKWAKYWLKDGHSNKYWWSSIRPVKDMDINAFCWRGDYFAKEAPDFSFSGPWDKSLTSRKAMIEAQEQSQ